MLETCTALPSNKEHKKLRLVSYLYDHYYIYSVKLVYSMIVSGIFANMQSLPKSLILNQ